MKRLMLLAAVCTGLLFSTTLRAETLKADDVTAGALKVWLSEKYGCKVDEDGDLIVNAKNGKIGISVLSKASAIRFWSNYGSYDKRSHEEMVRLANQFNDRKRLLRVSIEPKGGSTASSCDYYLLYPGGLDRANFLTTIEWIDGLKPVWERTVLDGEVKDK